MRPEKNEVLLGALDVAVLDAVCGAVHVAVEEVLRG